MTVNHTLAEARVIARTRSNLALDLRRLVGLAIRKAIRRMRAVRRQVAMNARHQHELSLLVHADDRMLADIGVTRHEVVAALHETRRFFCRNGTMEGAAARQEQAFRAAHRHTALPKTDAPSLAPDLPRIMKPSNVR